VNDSELDGLDIEVAGDAKEDDAAHNEADDAPVVRFVNKMLLDAIKGGSSDFALRAFMKRAIGCAFVRTACCTRLLARRSSWSAVSQRV